MPFRTSVQPSEGARALAQEHLAVLPTETVYGQGHWQRLPQQSAVFTTSEPASRPPLIAHVLNDEAAIAWE